MKISFHGATREVTGSCYLIETDQQRILVDCGMFQGSVFADAKNFRDFGFDPSTINALIVTHAHLDHVGRIPKLIKGGFKGKIYATAPTVELTKLVLEDAEQVMEDAMKREMRPKLYEFEDVERAMNLFIPSEYSKRYQVGDVAFRFRDAGHILGSSFVELEQKGGMRLAFSGDLGNVPDPILKPTAQLAEQDVLVIESTYGNRLHEHIDTRDEDLQKHILATVKKKGVLLIPAFAVERTQELLFELNQLIDKKAIPPVDIYLDSPLAIKASEVMDRYPEYFNQSTLHLMRMGDDPFGFPRLHKTLSRDESKTINEAPRPKIIIAGSGMMNGGRILHHLVRYLSSPATTVLIIGYQAHGTLGRKLYTGEKMVDVLGERINVKAEIHSIGAYSAHADQRQLLNWVKAAEHAPSHIYCTHGEEDASAALATRITEELRITADVPRFEQILSL